MSSNHQHFRQPAIKGGESRVSSRRAILTADSLTLFYEDKKVIDNVSFSVKFGEIVTILGPNGGGKTSLVRVLVGINKAYKGTVRYFGKLGIGYLPQNIKINRLMPMTVEYFLLRTYLGRRAASDLEDSMKYVDVERLLKRQVAELSAGETQLVLLARCLMMKPDLIILDEPVSCMDIEAKHNFYKLVARLVTECGVSVLMTSHDLHCVMSCSDRVICVNHSIRCEGTPEEITENAKFLSVFPNNV
ncbi:metal ABC transporter ATP-binding protein [Anaplasma marginale]|uniref:metal ABC transporter ATP-binding protein n=1 Tax=Anaplasma marginale TaxID=770 RepID=UPI00123B3533|nr:metal ABC transporter ATP-binding protein [Anaplasma marginale]KAA8473088.1 metal ABC transporter ATP-binding protein [Anaplasma marginale]KAB0451448.1 metal ABC transporter ATP-binding protein [Anaplasma marginale]